jgi:hypothetical protein
MKGSFLQPHNLFFLCCTETAKKASVLGVSPYFLLMALPDFDAVQLARPFLFRSLSQSFYPAIALQSFGYSRHLN